jgi:hypothetical protein
MAKLIQADTHVATTYLALGSTGVAHVKVAEATAKHVAGAVFERHRVPPTAVVAGELLPAALELTQGVTGLALRLDAPGQRFRAPPLRFSVVVPNKNGLVGLVALHNPPLPAAQLRMLVGKHPLACFNCPSRVLRGLDVDRHRVEAVGKAVGTATSKTSDRWHQREADATNGEQF